MGDLTTEQITREHTPVTDEINPSMPPIDRRKGLRRAIDRERWEQMREVGRHVREACMAIPSSILDAMYDRFDLWADHDKHIADYSKVRGFVLYMTVTFVVVYIIMTTKTVTTAYLWVMMSILAASMGERVLISFFKAWGGRGVADTGIGSVTMGLDRSPNRDPEKGIDPPDESKLPPVN